MAIFHIVGAGVSGLTLAMSCKKRRSVQFEKLGLPGGLARTEILNHKRIDCGPHLYHTNNREIRDYWQRLGQILEPQLYGTNYKSGGSTVSVIKKAWKNNFLMKYSLFLN